MGSKIVGAKLASARNVGEDLVSSRSSRRDETSSSPTHDRTRTIEQRVERLERANRRLTLVSVALGGMLVLVFVIGATKPDGGDKSPPYKSQSGVQDVIRAKKLEIVDDTGKVRVVLGLHADGASLWLLDEKGNIHARLSAHTDGATLVLRDEGGMPRAWLAVLPDGPQLQLFGKDGKVIWQAPPK